MIKFKFLLVFNEYLFGMSCTNTNRDPYANEIEEDNIIQREITNSGAQPSYNNTLMEPNPFRYARIYLDRK